MHLRGHHWRSGTGARVGPVSRYDRELQVDRTAPGLEIDSGTTGRSVALAHEPRQSAKCCRTAGIEPAWTGVRWGRRGRRPVRNDESAMGLEIDSGTTIADVVSHRVNRGWFTR